MNQHQTPPLWELSPAEKSAAGKLPAGKPSAGKTAAGKTAAKKNRGQTQPAPERPIARVIVDVPLPHLDRTFDYQVPAGMRETAVAGCRVRVRFAGQLVDGFLLERADTTEHQGRLSFLERVVSSEPVLSADLASYARAVADRYGGSLIDVLRLAIPPRHAKTEEESAQALVEQQTQQPEQPQKPESPARQEKPEPEELPEPEKLGEGRLGFPLSPWKRYDHGPDLVEALSSGRLVNAVWQAMPGEQWPRRLAELAVITAAAGRGALLIVPDQRDLARLHQACAALIGEESVVALYAGLGPSERYRRWLRVLRGQVRIVVGTRAAMFAPVVDAGLFVVWDDGDDLHSEPRMPYPHVRDVLMLRAHEKQASLVVAGQVRTAEAQLLVESGWASSVEPIASELRAAAPRVTPTGDDFEMARDPAARTARLPLVAFEAVRAALAQGTPALVQVPRSGYAPVVACAQCRTPARCRRCAGPLAISAPETSESSPRKLPREDSASLRCGWCAVVETNFRCSSCGGTRLRAVVVGAQRTASELGRAFPNTRIRTSSGDHILDFVPAEPAVVVCTPGAEPVAVGGYGAALLLDGWALLGRSDLRAAEETLRRWMAASALVRPSAQGGRVVVNADSSLAPVQALIRWAPAWHAARELAERRELGFPPAMRMASVEGERAAVSRFVAELSLPDAAELLGPVPLGEFENDEGERERMLIRVPRGEGKALATLLARAQAARTARRESDPVRIQLDPLKIV